jgi:hypothetical protein
MGTATKTFRVLVRGENFFLNLEGAVKRYGFYTTRLVDAPNEAEAERLAIEMLRENERLRGQVLNDRSDRPMLFAEEIAELSPQDAVEPRAPGLAFFEDQGTAH